MLVISVAAVDFNANRATFYWGKKKNQTICVCSTYAYSGILYFLFCFLSLSHSCACVCLSNSRILFYGKVKCKQNYECGTMERNQQHTFTTMPMIMTAMFGDIHDNYMGINRKLLKVRGTICFETIFFFCLFGNWRENIGCHLQSNLWHTQIHTKMNHFWLALDIEMINIGIAWRQEWMNKHESDAFSDLEIAHFNSQEISGYVQEQYSWNSMNPSQVFYFRKQANWKYIFFRASIPFGMNSSTLMHSYALKTEKQRKLYSKCSDMHMTSQHYALCILLIHSQMHMQCMPMMMMIANGIERAKNSRNKRAHSAVIHSFIDIILYQIHYGNGGDIQ